MNVTNKNHVQRFENPNQEKLTMDAWRSNLLAPSCFPALLGTHWYRVYTAITFKQKKRIREQENKKIKKHRARKMRKTDEKLA